MIPPEPPRQPQLGFLYFPPYRVQGFSVAGEETFVQIPELDVCFDIGRCPRPALTSHYVALSHGHMDHVAGLAYYFSQRHFQGMGVGTVLCHPKLEQPIRELMEAWVEIETQRTPYRLIAMDPAGDSVEHEIKNNYYIRAFDTVHTSPSLGYVIVERRSKLKDEYVGLPQEKLVELKKQGQEITRLVEVPWIAYMGDTSPGDHFLRDDVRQAKILITECTFSANDHRERARIGKHIHLDDLVKIIDQLENEVIVLNHLSRRTHLGQARRQLDRLVPAEHRDRVFILMDNRTNRQRYQDQVAEAERKQAARD